MVDGKESTDNTGTSSSTSPLSYAPAAELASSIETSTTTATAVSTTTTTSDETTKSDKDLAVEAVQHLQTGKRHMIVSDYRSAVPCFEHACKLLDSCYGTGATECGEAYLHYGIALFELSRLDEGFADGVVNIEDPSSVDDEADDEEVEEQSQDGEDECEAEAKSDETPAEAATDEKVDIDLSQPSTSRGDNPTSENGDKSDDEEENSATNVEIAWEVLGLAQEIFARSEPTKENRLNLAEALQKLAEISIEWENNENAIYLLNECLELRKELLEPSDRLIASTYHYLGIAFSFKGEYDNSNSCFERALSVIQLRIDHLNSLNNEKLDEFEQNSNQREIKQLEDLIPELRAKIEDMREQMESQYKTLKTLESEKEENKQTQVTQTKPVNNISHLIKRKKETNDGDEVAENGDSHNGVKKQCIDVSKNGNASMNNTTVESGSNSTN